MDNKILFEHTDWAEIKKIGDLLVTTGKIVATDPLTFSLSDSLHFTQKINKGNYPVHIYIDKSQNRIAFAKVTFKEGTPMTWKIAFCEGQNISDLKDDEIFGYGVDTGLGCFMDLDTAKILDNKMTELSNDPNFVSYYDDVLADELEKNENEWTNHLPDKNLKNNVLVFESGWGDGFYPSYFGYDENGEILVLVTDFAVYK